MILISENIKQITDTWWELMYDPVSDTIVKVSVQQEVEKRLPYKVSDKWDSTPQWHVTHNKDFIPMGAMNNNNEGEGTIEGGIQR